MFNTNTTLIKFYNILKRHYPAFSNKILNYNHLYKVLYPKKKFKKKTIVELEFDINKLLEIFLGCLNCFKHKDINKLISFEELCSRQFDSVAINHRLNQINFSIKNDKINNSKYYYNKYFLFKNLNNFYKDKNIKKYSDYLYSEFECFQSYSYFVKLDIYIKFLSSEFDTGIRIILPQIKKFINDISKYIIEYNLPITNIIYYSSLLLNTFEEKYYHILKKTFFAFKNELGFSQQYSVYKILFIFLSLNRQQYTQIHKFKTEFYNVGKRFLKDLNNYDIHYLNHNFFYEYINSCLHLNKIDEAEMFIKKYELLLNEDIRDIFIKYCSAKILFYKNKYSEAVICLKYIKHTEWFYEIELYYLKILCFIELNTNLEVERLLINFKQFLIRNKIWEFYKREAKYFINYINIYLRILDKQNINMFLQFKKRILSDEYCPYHEWFISKIKILEGLLKVK